MEAIDPQHWYPAKEAAEFLGVTEATVKAYCRDGKISARQIGPRKKWHVLGKAVMDQRSEWGLDGSSSQQVERN